MEYACTQVHARIAQTRQQKYGKQGTGRWETTRITNKLNTNKSQIMFRLTREESKSLLLNGESQNVIPKGYNFGGSTPYAWRNKV